MLFLEPFGSSRRALFLTVENWAASCYCAVWPIRYKHIIRVTPIRSTR